MSFHVLREPTDYFIIDGSVLLNTSLSLGAKCIWAMIKAIDAREGKFPSHLHLFELTGLNDKNIFNLCLQELIDANLIQRVV